MVKDSHLINRCVPAALSEYLGIPETEALNLCEGFIAESGVGVDLESLLKNRFPGQHTILDVDKICPVTTNHTYFMITVARAIYDQVASGQPVLIRSNGKSDEFPGHLEAVMTSDSIAHLNVANSKTQTLRQISRYGGSIITISSARI